MTRFAKFLAPAGLMMAAAVAMPAQAQVDGKIATVNIARTVLNTSAFQNSQQLVRTQYAQQLTLLDTKNKERETLLVKYDKNGDQQLDKAETDALKKSPDAAKLKTLEDEIQSLGNQIDGGSVFAIEQILPQFKPALDEVVAAKQIKMVVDPNSLLYSPPEADISEAVVASLNVKVPAVGVVPEAGWQPNQRAVQIFQEIQQIVLIARYLQQQQQQAQAAQPQQPAPAAQPQQPAPAAQPVGR